MIETILTSSACHPAGSFDFTPEGYAKASYWIPEDGFTWEEFTSQDFSSLEDHETKLAAFKAETAGKLEITKAIYWDGSLRALFPDRWILAYTRDRAWKTINNEKVPLYSQLKRTLYLKSIILGYGEGPIHQPLQNRDTAKYIKEHCASSARLKAIALKAYESVANMKGYHTWTAVSPPVFLCLAAAKSSLDAMSAVLWAILFKETPTGKRLPSMFTLHKRLSSENHPFSKSFAKLYESSWFSKLQLARDKVIHRSASPVVHDDFGAAFDFDLGLFKDMPLGKFRIGKPRAGAEKTTKRLHLDKIMRGFVVGLEKWENTNARKLRSLAWFPSFNSDGILLGMDFNDQNLLRDGAGPTHMVTSHPQGIRYKYTFVGLHPFSAGSNPPH